MIIQERQNDKLAFNQPLHRYEKGFGDVHGDHWLGLEKIYAFLKHGKKLILRVEIAGDHCGTNADERNDPTFNVHGEYNFEVRNFAFFFVIRKSRYYTVQITII